jgi:hypothetical protein
MSDIPFTQFLMPDGRPSRVTIDRPDEISAKAHALIERGFRFECEMLPTREISFTITNDDGDHAIEVCNNGPEVLIVIDRMIMNFDADKISRAA